MSKLIGNVKIGIDTDRIFKRVNEDLQWLEKFNSFITSLIVCGGVASVIVAFIVFEAIIRLKDESSWFALLISITVVLCVIAAIAWVIDVVKTAALHYPSRLYTKKFIQMWNDGYVTAMNSRDPESICRWFLELPRFCLVINNINYINTVINHDFGCYVDADGDGYITDKNTGAKHKFYLDYTILEHSFNGYSGDSLIVLINEREHVLMDKPNYERNSSYEVIEIKT